MQPEAGRPASDGGVFSFHAPFRGSTGNIRLNWKLGTMPALQQSPTSQTARAGEKVSFTAEATGLPVPSYQWRFNGASIAGATNATLTLTNVQSVNAGGYSVVASNFIGSITSATAELVVSGAASFQLGSGAGWTNGGFRLQLSGPTTGCVIEASTNLSVWRPLFTNVSLPSDFEFIDRTAADYPWRFYRAVKP